MEVQEVLRGKEGQVSLDSSEVENEQQSSPTNAVNTACEKTGVDLDKYESKTDEISYQYLTFKTEVATEAIWPDDSSIQDVPAIPNYQQYDDPFDWPYKRKVWMTILSCSVNATAAYASGAYAAPASVLEAKWNISHTVYNVGFPVFTAGFGIAPMVLAPFSEINGRRPVFVISGLVFVVCGAGCAVTQSFAGMLISRFLQGVGGSTFSTMVGGIMADIWVTEERNTAMVIFTGATLFGTGIGPLVSGFVAQHLLWRWVFYIQIVISGGLIGLITIFFRETRGSVLLSRKAKMMNRYYKAIEKTGAIGVVVPETETTLVITGEGTPPAPSNDHVKPSQTTDPSKSTPKIVRLRYRVKSDEERATILKMISVSLYRPIHMLVTEPVVFWFSAWLSFAWGILYLQFASIPLVFSTVYGFTLEQTGTVFTAMSIAAIISTILSIYQEKWGMKHYPQRIGGSPEGRLYFACIESALMPVGLFMFAWTCFPSIHWIVPTIAMGLYSMGIFSVFLAVSNYSADVYRIYASSALAGIGLCRNLLAGSFPIVTGPLFNNLGFHAASSLLGGIAAALTLVPWVLIFFGPRIRAASRIAKHFVEEDEKLKEKKRDVEEGSASPEDKGGDSG